MTQALWILDFDGTMTDAEREGVPFREGYLEDLATLTGLALDEIRRLATEFESEVAANPGRYGWLFNGRVVAPAMVDPYLRMMPVARQIFDRTQCFTSESDRTRLLDGILYKYNYQKTITAFREGVADLFHRLHGRDVWIVTNSHTEPVQIKIRHLAEVSGNPHAFDWLLDRVKGRAKKYEIDDGFTEVEEALMLPGLLRPVLLRRARYFEVLDGLRKQARLSWQDMNVVGDIFELDLALPLTLGARVFHLVGPYTPEHEQVYLKTHPRAKIIKQISDLLSHMD